MHEKAKRKKKYTFLYNMIKKKSYKSSEIALYLEHSLVSAPLLRMATEAA